MSQTFLTQDCEDDYNNTISNQQGWVVSPNYQQQQKQQHNYRDLQEKQNIQSHYVQQVPSIPNSPIIGGQNPNDFSFRQTRNQFIVQPANTGNTTTIVPVPVSSGGPVLQQCKNNSCLWVWILFFILLALLLGLLYKLHKEHENKLNTVQRLRRELTY